MIEMTYNQALKIQADQIEHYHRDGMGPLTTAGIAELKRQTKPCPFDPDMMVAVTIINGLVPRGGSIENIMGCDYSRECSGCSLSVTGAKRDHDREHRRQVRLDKAARANDRITKRNGQPMYC